jgi:hypothetical protein
MPPQFLNKAVHPARRLSVPKQGQLTRDTHGRVTGFKAGEPTKPNDSNLIKYFEGKDGTNERVQEASNRQDPD